MTYGASARPSRPIRIRRLRVAGLAAGIVAIVAVLGDLLPASSPTSSTASTSSTAAGRADHQRDERRGAVDGADGSAPGATATDDRGALGQDDGAVPDGATVFDDGIPGVANLDPALLDAVRQAARDAAGDGVDFVVNSGWRSREYQEHLLQDAVAEYGSEAEAARWVATPDTSAHVSGDAIDIGPTKAAAWLSQNGAAYGLCQIYANEPWHFELRSGASVDGCPAMYADAAHDPRMQP